MFFPVHAWLRPLVLLGATLAACSSLRQPERVASRSALPPVLAASARQDTKGGPGRAQTAPAAGSGAVAQESPSPPISPLSVDPSSGCVLAIQQPQEAAFYDRPAALLPYFQLDSSDPRWAVARQRIQALQAQGVLPQDPGAGATPQDPAGGNEIYFRQAQQGAEYWVLRTGEGDLDQNGVPGLPEWSLEHVSATGTRAAVRWQDNPTNAITAPLPVAAFDFEGDGVTELLTLTQCTNDASGSLHNVGKIWTLAGGEMVESKLATGFAITGFVDQDGDGRPDLLIDPYRVLLTDPNANVYEARLGWSLLVHSIPGGTFNDHDMVARAYAKWLCPDAPSPASVFQQREECWAPALHCIALYEQGRQAALEGLSDYCERQHTPPLDGWCSDNLEQLSGILAARLPVSLAGAGSLRQE